MIGAPGAASPRKQAASAAWPPGVISTSPADAPTSAAKYARNSVRPASGTRSHAPGRRAARTSAAPSNAVGCNSAGRYPVDNTIAPGTGGRINVSSASASIERAPSGTACHDGSGVTTLRAAATNVPRPGRVSTTPRATSTPMARCTVAGPARCRTINSRTDGSRAPGDAPATTPSRLAITAAAALSCGMSNGSNATEQSAITQRGEMWGLLGVLAFSFSLPFTRVAVEELDATFVGLGRALVAAALAAIFLTATKAKLPARKDIPRFAIVGLGVVIGFPLFSSLALKSLESAHASIVVGLLPAATAVFAVLRAGERPTKAFWFAAAAGLLAVIAFAATQGVNGIAVADLLVLVAVILGALGYAEGGALSRTYGGPQTICWALLVTAPFLVIPVAVAAQQPMQASPEAWLSFAYVSAISMFLGFFAWY